ncbi:hypothetical protein ACJX0J_019407, partial [Zea mays]
TGQRTRHETKCLCAKYPYSFMVVLFVKQVNCPGFQGWDIKPRRSIFFPKVNTLNFFGSIQTSMVNANLGVTGETNYISVYQSNHQLSQLHTHHITWHGALNSIHLVHLGGRILSMEKSAQKHMMNYGHNALVIYINEIELVQI